jgi:hypothetical protein
LEESEIFDAKISQFARERRHQLCQNGVDQQLWPHQKNPLESKRDEWLSTEAFTVGAKKKENLLEKIIMHRARTHHR